MSISFADDFADYGNLPDLSAVSIMRFRVIGDVSATAADNTFYLDNIIVGDAFIPCQGLSHDTDDNCYIDMVDFADFAAEWLHCGWAFCD